MSLTKTFIENLRPEAKVRRYADGQGLYLNMAVSGSKIWEQRCYYKGGDTYITLGSYPTMSLLDARIARDANKQLMKQGVHPNDIKLKLSDSVTSEYTFQDIFNEWHKKKSGEWSDDYPHDVKQRAECYILPFIGNKSIDAINTPDIVAVLKRIDEKGVIDTLYKIKGILNGVFSYAVSTNIVAINPVREVSNDLFTKKKQSSYATITNPKDIGWLLRTIDGHKGTYQVRTALTLAPYLMLRPGEIAKLTWQEVDLNDRLIRIDAGRMKMKKTHIVPMSNQVFSVFQWLSNIDTGSAFVFPSPRNKKQGITTNALLTSLRSLGVDKELFTTHGFRHMASTRLNELGFNSDVIERQLAHADSNKVRARYNQAEYLEERKKMMQYWSDYLDKLKND
ncbi:MAG: tyrosine-type recombinase/integrase [Candidatus Thioglobus sp.]|jgi:integrase